MTYKKFMQNFKLENLKGRNHMGDLGMHERKILNGF
jgi:hypothetical protein